MNWLQIHYYKIIVENNVRFWSVCSQNYIFGSLSELLHFLPACNDLFLQCDFFTCSFMVFPFIFLCMRTGKNKTCEIDIKTNTLSFGYNLIAIANTLSFYLTFFTPFLFVFVHKGRIWVLRDQNLLLLQWRSFFFLLQFSFTIKNDLFIGRFPPLMFWLWLTCFDNLIILFLCKENRFYILTPKHLFFENLLFC